jgi:hypothetical protein
VFALYAETARKMGNRHVHLSAVDAIARIRIDERRPHVTMGPTKRSEL